MAIFKLYNNSGVIVKVHIATGSVFTVGAEKVDFIEHTNSTFELHIKENIQKYNLSDVEKENGDPYLSVSEVADVITGAKNAGGGGGGGDATAANQATQITEAQTANTKLNSIDSTNNSIKGNTADTVQALEYLNKAIETGQTVTNFYVDTGTNYFEAEDVGKNYVLFAFQRTSGTQSLIFSSLVGLAISNDNYVLYIATGGTVTGPALNFSNAIGGTGFSYARGADDNEITGFDQIFGTTGEKKARLNEPCNLNDVQTTEVFYLVVSPLGSDLEIYAGVNLKQIT